MKKIIYLTFLLFFSSFLYAGNTVSIVIHPDKDICYNCDGGKIFANYTDINHGIYAPIQSVQIKWYRKKLNGGTWEALLGSGESYNVGSLTQTYLYKAVIEYYSCMEPGGYGNWDYHTIESNVLTITVVNPLRSGGKIGYDQEMCKGTPNPLVSLAPASSYGEIDGIVVGKSGDVNYTWQSSENGTTNWIDIPNETGLGLILPYHETTKYYRRRANNINVSTFVYSNIVKIEIGTFWDAGEIGSNQTICYNTIPANLTNIAHADIGNHTYQWETSPTGSGSWTSLNSETSAFLNFTEPLQQTTYYRRKATTQNCGTLYSNTVKIQVRAELLGGDIGEDVSVCEGENVPPITFVTNPTGGAGAYIVNIEKSYNQSNWTVASGARLPLNYTPEFEPGTVYYRVRISENCGKVYSNVKTYNFLTTLTQPLIASSQSIDYNTVPQPLQLVTEPSGGTGNYSYQWQQSINEETWQNINGATSTTFAPGPLSTTTHYRLNAIDGECGSVNSNVVTISVYTELNGGVIGHDQTICYNSRPDEFENINSPSGGNGIYTYQWQHSSSGEYWSNLELANSLEYHSNSLTTSRYFRRQVKSGSLTAYSNMVLVTVNNEIQPPTLEGMGTYCMYENVTLNVVEPQTNLTYHWKINDTIAYVGISYNIIGLNNNYVLNVKAIDGLNCSSAYKTVQVNVLPELLPPIIGLSQTIDYGSIPNQIKILYIATGGIGQYSYQWQGSSDNLEWNNIIGATSSNFEPGELTNTTHYRLRVTDEQCGETFSNEITITVHPDLQPGEIGSNHTVCYNTKSDTLKSLQNPQGGNGNFTYQWQKSGNGVEWENINYTNQLEYVSQPLTSSTYFRRTVTSGTLVKHSNPVLVTANNQLFAPVVNGAGIYCKDQNAGFSVSNPNPEHTYHWLIDGSIDYIGNTYYIYNIEKTTELKTKAVDALGCESPNTTSVAELDPIKADFIISKTPVDVGEKVDFISTSTNASHWNWNLGLAETYTVENPTAYYNVPGTYDISLTVSSVDLCFDTKKMEGALVVLDPNGVNVPTAQAAILVYPNPTTNGLVYIDANGTAIDLYQIYNSAGVLVKQGQFLAEIEQLSLPTQGMFLIRLFSKGINTVNLKIIAQ